MRLANEIAAAAMEHVQGVLRPGMTCAQAAAEWQGFVHGEGTGWKGQVELALPFSLVWSGPGIKTFTATTDGRSSRTSRRCSRSGSAPTATGPTTRRTSAPARCTPRYAELLDQLTAVYDDAVAFCTPGASLAELDRRVREGIAATGYPGQPSHPICHGIGARAHEPPYAHQAGGGEIAEGMVLAIEPGMLLARGRRPAPRGQLPDHRGGPREALPVPGRRRCLLTAQIWTGALNDAHAIGGSVGLYDTTLRDGEQTVGVVLDPEQKLELARAIDDLGIERIEAGFPRVSEDDWRAVELIAGAGLRRRGLGLLARRRRRRGGARRARRPARA